MAPEADLPTSDPEPTRMDGALRLLESLMFCCLSALVVLWVGDRMRSLDFDPVAVTPCIGAACVPYSGPHSGSLWSLYSDALDPIGVTSLSGQNLCRQLADTLESRGPEAQGVDQILDLITARGTVTVRSAEEEPWIIAPGPRNDDFWDVIRDAVSWKPSRGCYPINYKPVFWPLWAGWMLLASLRLFRGRQQAWARR